MSQRTPRIWSNRVAFCCLGLALLLVATNASAAPIRLWHGYDGEELEALQEALAKAPFDVETLAIPYNAFAAKVEAAIPLGEGPDLFIDAHSQLGEYRARGLIAPVGDALESGAFTPIPIDAVTDKGVAWAVPLSQKCVALYVNTDLVSDVPPDLEGIAALKGSLPKDVFPLVYEARSAYYHMAVLSAFGGAFLGPNDTYEFVGPSAEKSVEFVRGLADMGALPSDPDGSMVNSLFASGRAAFAISGPWLAARLRKETPVHYRVLPLPKVRATDRALEPFLTVESIMLSPAGAKRADARALARFLAGPDAARIRERRAHVVTARADVPPPHDDGMLAVFAKQASTSIIIPSSRAMNAVWEPANRAIRKVFSRGAEAPEALAEGKRRFDDVRRPLPEPHSPLPGAAVLGLVLLGLSIRFLQLSRRENWGAAFRKSLPAYRYLIHAVLVLLVIVVVPLVMGATTSLFAGTNESQRYVGLANFISILTARGGPLFASGSFYFVLLVTLLWTLLNITLHVAIGVALALLLSKPNLKLRALYRVLLIVPWAVPSYVTALAWKGMFHRQFGAVTGLIYGLNKLFGTHLEPIAWFSNFATAFAANLATNVWLGFPFMMVVTLSALTAVPADVLEAAQVDGATRWQRLRLITLPMIRPTLAPSITLGAIWTFNMFNVVFLVSGGDPDGRTDILVSEAYRWAFTREAQYGYAAAYAVLIFLLLFSVTRPRTKNGSDAEKKPELSAEVA